MTPARRNSVEFGSPESPWDDPDGAELEEPESPWGDLDTAESKTPESPWDDPDGAESPWDELGLPTPEASPWLDTDSAPSAASAPESGSNFGWGL